VGAIKKVTVLEAGAAVPLEQRVRIVVRGECGRADDGSSANAECGSQGRH
jgi:hypothetical protein